MNHPLPRLALVLVGVCAATVGCSKAQEQPAAAPAAAVPAAPTSPPPPPAPPVATAIAAPADIKPDNADQVAAALEKEIEADAADEDKE
jgi:hypothetical protein